MKKVGKGGAQMEPRIFPFLLYPQGKEGACMFGNSEKGKRWERFDDFIKECFHDDSKIRRELLKYNMMHPMLSKKMSERIALASPYLDLEITIDEPNSCVKVTSEITFIMDDIDDFYRVVKETVQAKMESVLKIAVKTSAMLKRLEQVSEKPAVDLAGIFSKDLVIGAQKEDWERYKSEHADVLKSFKFIINGVSAEFVKRYPLKRIIIMAIQDPEFDIEESGFVGGDYQFLLNICFRSPTTAKTFVNIMEKLYLFN